MKTQHNQLQSCISINNLQPVFIQDQISLIHSKLIVKQRVLQLVMFLLGLLAGLFMR